MGKDVVVIGGSLVGLELAEWLAERGRNVVLLEEGQALGLPMAMPRRWTAVRRADEVGVVVHRRATVTAITKDRVGFTVVDQAHSAPADVEIHAADTASGAQMAEHLREAGGPVVVVGEDSNVG